MLTVTTNRNTPAGRVPLSAVYARADSLHRGGLRAGESEGDFSFNQQVSKANASPRLAQTQALQEALEGGEIVRLAF